MTEEYENFKNRIKLTQAIHLYGAFCYFVFGIIYFYILNSTYLLICNFIAGTLCFGNLYAYNKFNKNYLTHTFLIIVYFGLVNISVHVGIKHIPLIFWGMSVSIASAFINEETGTFVWGLLGLLFLPLVLVLRNSGFHFGMIPLNEYQNIFFLCATYIGLLAFFIYSILLHKRKLRQTFSLLTKSQQDLATLIRVLCHDIGNPIHQIRHFSCQLARSNDQKYYELMQSSMDRLDNTLGNVREYMAVATGKKELPMECVSLTESINEAVASLKEKAQSKSTSFEIRNDGDLDLYLIFEKNSLVNQVLINILDNAIKFSKENSTILIGVDCSSEEFAILTIKDQGVGIPQNRLGKIFEPYTPTTTRGTIGEYGSGFGLPIVASYLKFYGASISIESNVGNNHGTEVTLTFPRV